MFNFFLLKEYLKWEINEGFHREDYLAAILATEIRRIIAKDPKQVKPSDFPLPLKFDFGKKEGKELDVQTRANRAKNFFFRLTGLTGSKKKAKK